MRHLAPLAVALVIAACSGGGSESSPPVNPAPRTGAPGSPSAGFGNAGLATFEPAAIGNARGFADIAVKPDGSMYAAAQTSSFLVVVASVTATGVLDTRFAGTGFIRPLPDPVPNFLGVGLFAPQVAVAGNDALYVSRVELITGCLRCAPIFAPPAARKVDASGVAVAAWAHNGAAQSVLLPHAMAFTAAGSLHIYGYRAGGDERLLQVIEPGGTIREPGPYGSEAAMCSGTGRIGDHSTIAAGDGDETIAAWTVSHSPEFSSECITRRLPDGSPVAGFGMDGVARIPDFAFGDPKSMLAGRPGGGVLIVFLSRPGFRPWLAALRGDGTLDTSFGNAGALRVIPGAESRVDALAVQPDGKILVAARSRLVRLEASGVLDRGFGTDGFAELTARGRWFSSRALRVLPDWSLLLAGTSYDCPTPDNCSSSSVPALMKLLGGER